MRASGHSRIMPLPVMTVLPLPPYSATRPSAISTVNQVSHVFAGWACAMMRAGDARCVRYSVPARPWSPRTATSSSPSRHSASSPSMRTARRRPLRP
jgi:hypothetical protein